VRSVSNINFPLLLFVCMHIMLAQLFRGLFRKT
jgi:hypothetical protein